MMIRSLLLALAAFSLSCKQSAPTQQQEAANRALEVHLQSWYSLTPVSVYVDRNQVFSDTVSTGYVLAVAAVIPVQVTPGWHLLGVTVPNRASRDTSFLIEDTLYAAVHYDSADAGLDFHVQCAPFHYR